MLKDEAAMKRFGHTMVCGHARPQAAQVLDVPGCRWRSAALDPKPQVLLHQHRADLEDLADLRGRRGRVAGQGSRGHRRSLHHPAAGGHLDHRGRQGPVGRHLPGGKARYFDISDPHAPKQVYEAQIGSQINMVSQSWDGKRVYFSSSLLGNWDKTGDADEQYVKLYHWDGKELTHEWTVDFYAEGLGARTRCGSARTRCTASARLPARRSWSRWFSRPRGLVRPLRECREDFESRPGLRGGFLLRGCAVRT